MSTQEKVRHHILDQGLRLDDLSPNPVSQFEVWLKQARDSGIRYPTAMSLATVNCSGEPSQRMVMLRIFDHSGFVFFTSLSSRKSDHLKANPKASILFPWHMLERQVQISGAVEPLGKLEVLKYFASRPKNTQLAAWLSEQSSPTKNRNLLENKLKEIKARFASGDVSMPAFWGGYRIVPQSFEFWQTGKDHVNDRFAYTLDRGDWKLERIAP